MDYKDYYQVMGLKNDANAHDIKLAYRRLARKYHPDLSKEPNAEEKFKELGEAYEVLKDPEKRRIYDQHGKDRDFSQYERPAASGAHNWGGFTGGDEPSAEDFFESLFGARAHSHSHRAGADLLGNISISLEDAYQGVVKDLQLPAKDSSKKDKQTLRVKIPAGVKSGQQLRLTGQGEPGHAGAANGDLLLTIHVSKHSLFDVMGNDIYVTLPITPWEAALGATLVVPTLGGKVELKIPAGSQTGQSLRLKKRGLPATSPGDQYVLLKIVIPQPVTDADRNLYKTMEESMPFNPRDKMGV